MPTRTDLEFLLIVGTFVMVLLMVLGVLPS